MKTVIETRKVNKIRYYIVWVYDDKEVIGFMIKKKPAIMWKSVKLCG